MRFQTHSLRAYAVLIAGCAATLFSACSSTKPTGVAFAQHSFSGNDRSLVYFYRALGESSGYGRPYFIAVNQHHVIDLLHGGYFPYVANPGKIAVTSDLKDNSYRAGLIIPMLAEAVANPQAARLEINVEPGQIYYVKMHPENNFTHFTPRLKLVTKEVGEAEISRCKLFTSKP